MTATAESLSRASFSHSLPHRACVGTEKRVAKMPHMTNHTSHSDFDDKVRRNRKFRGRTSFRA